MLRAEIVGLDGLIAAAAAGQVEVLQRSPARRTTCGVGFVSRSGSELPAALPPLEVVPGPDQYVARIADATIIGGSSLRLIGDPRRQAWALHDLHGQDRGRRFLLTDGATRQCVGMRCELLPPLDGTAAQSLPNGIALTLNYGWNYYHFVFEVLCRIRAVEALGLPPSVPWLVDATTLEVPAFRALFEAVDRERRPVVCVAKGAWCHVEELYVVGDPHRIPANHRRVDRMRADDHAFDAASLVWLRERLLPLARRRDDLPRRIYLSRSRASVRRRFNEADLLPALERHGFVSVAPETLDVFEQIGLFAGAEAVVGGSGAAFTNLAFASPGCHALVFAREQLQATFFAPYARQCDVRLAYLTEREGPPELYATLHEAFRLDPARVDAALGAIVDAIEGGGAASARR
ncbi:MAG: glycosyltransferase family 61 protein [Deltaproteobacteria bacterium]|nr:glycosyltransferase family 61 protein [Deltaproteobacteria bacterium]